MGLDSSPSHERITNQELKRTRNSLRRYGEDERVRLAFRENNTANEEAALHPDTMGTGCGSSSPFPDSSLLKQQSQVTVPVDRGQKKLSLPDSSLRAHCGASWFFEQDPAGMDTDVLS